MQTTDALDWAFNRGFEAGKKHQAGVAARDAQDAELSKSESKPQYDDVSRQYLFETAFNAGLDVAVRELSDNFEALADLTPGRARAVIQSRAKELRK